MKYFISILAFIISLVTFISCQEDCVKPSGINGEWIWEKSVSTWGTSTPENTGQQRKLRIDDYVYREIINDSLVFESQYDLIIRNDSCCGDRIFIVFSPGYEEGIGISDSKLIRVETMYFDGFTHYYHRN